MKKIIQFLLIFSLSIGLSGCVSEASIIEEDEINPATEETEQAKPTEETEENQETVIRDSIRVLVSPVQNLDPVSAYSDDKTCLYEIYESLFDIQENNLVSILADSSRGEYHGYDHDAGTDVYTIYLCDNISDQDGNLLKASDAVFCYERMVQFMGEEWKMLSKVEAVDDTTFKLTFSGELTGKGELFPYLTDVLLYTQSAFESHDSFQDTACGTGPYILESSDSAGAVLKKNDSYWKQDNLTGANVANVNTIQYIYSDSGSEQVIALETGKADMSAKLQYSDAQDFAVNGVYADKFSVYQNWDTTNNILLTNTTSSQCLSNSDLRSGVLYAIDKNKLADTFGEGGGAALHAPANPSLPDCMASWSSMQNPQNLSLDTESVKNYIRSSGYINERMILLAKADSQSAELADAIQSQLRAFGITVYVKTVDATEFDSALADTSSWDLAILELKARYSVSQVLCGIWNETYASNKAISSQLNAQIKELLESVSSEKGCTEENLTSIVSYLTDNAYAIGLAQKCTAIIIPADTKSVYVTNQGMLLPGACVY